MYIINQFIKLRATFFTVFIGFIFQLNAQEILRFQVDTGFYDRIDCPVSIQFSPSDFGLQSEDIQLVELTENSKVPLPSQSDPEQTDLLWFILKGFTPKQTIRRFALVKKSKKQIYTRIDLIKKDGALQLRSNNRPILNYQYEMTFPPKGVDKKYKKSGFIHPLWSPGGEALTRIQPPDHFHHYGIWAPWTKTHVNKREVDFWNLAKGQGTVLFKKFKHQTRGDVFSGFTAVQEHIDLGAASKNRLALNEELQVNVWNTNTEKRSWLIDYTSKFKSPLESGILFDAYRYGGGIGFRATEKWNKNNTSVLTSEKKDRLTADGSRAKWAIIEGATETKEGRSGILFMSFPKNRQHPEPMRVWPVDSNKGRGDLFFEFCPIRHVEWPIESHKEYSLKYRLLVFDGKLSAEQAEIYWQCFANPPKITIEVKN